MGSRKIQLHVSPGCGTPAIHQPIYLQLSLGNRWIPPRPIRIPSSLRRPDGKPDTHPNTELETISKALYDALYQANHPARIIPSVGPLGAHEIHTLEFYTFEQEIDYSCVGVEPKQTGKEVVGGKQLKIGVTVGPGDSPFVVKPIDSLVLFNNRHGWGDIRPHDIEFAPITLPREGGVAGDKFFSLGWHDRNCKRASGYNLNGRLVLPYAERQAPWSFPPHEHWLARPEFLEVMRGVQSDGALGLGKQLGASESLANQAGTPMAPSHELGSRRDRPQQDELHADA